MSLPPLPHLHLLRPFWLLALIPLALLLAALWRRDPGASAWRGVVDAHLLPALLTEGERGPARLPLVLLGLGWLLLAMVLAGPVWTRIPQPVFAASWPRVILLDLSDTLDAPDLTPSRLARARFEILDLLAGSQDGQAALLAFGPEPFVVSPLTSDARTIAVQVPHLATGLIPAPGSRRTDLALDRAGALLAQAGARGGHVILVSDGVGAPAQANAVARRLAADGHRVSVLAVGTAAGAPIPDSGGGVRIARFDAELLRALARAGGGRYVEARPDDEDTRLLLAAGPDPAQIDPRALAQADRWREEGSWLLLPLLPLAALAFRRGWLS